MKEFIISHKLGDGSKQKAVFEAKNKYDAKKIAEAEGYNVLKVENTVNLDLEKYLGKYASSGKKLKPKQLIKFFTQLLFLVQSDFTVSKAITSMRRGAKERNYRRFLSSAYTDLQLGKKFSEILRPEFGFSEELRLQIESGESSGELPNAIQIVLKRLETEAGTFATIKKQLAYPAVVIVIMVFVVYYILTSVVPGLADVLISNGGELPAITVMLINFSSFIEVYGPVILGIIVASVLLFIYLSKNPKSGYYISYFFCRFKLTREVVINSNLSRYFYITGNMMRSDMMLHHSLDIAAKAIPNFYMKKVLLGIPPELKSQGISLESIFKNKWFTNEFTDLIAIGVQTGRLYEVFEKLSEETGTRAETKVKFLTTMMEPAITIVIGAMVAIIVMSLFMPMFTIIDTI